MSSAMDKILQAMAHRSHVSSQANRDQDAGAKLLALLHAGQEDAMNNNNNNALNGGLFIAPNARGISGTELLAAASGNAANASTVSYDREFLLSCQDSPICAVLSPALEAKLEEIPLMKRKTSPRRSYENNNNSNVGNGDGSGRGNSAHFDNADGGLRPFLPFTLFKEQQQQQHVPRHPPSRAFHQPKRRSGGEPSIVDSLPLRPTAQIFTWDPDLGAWVPRDRPQEP